MSLDTRSHRADIRLLRRWQAFLARRRADRQWADALAAAVTPAHRDELLTLRDIDTGARARS